MWFKICATILPVFLHQQVSGPRARHMQNPVQTAQSLERFAANSTANHRRKKNNSERKPKCSDQIRMQREMELKENSQQRNTGFYLRLLRTSSARLGCNNNAREQDDKNWREQAEGKRHNSSFGVAWEMLRTASANGLHVENSSWLCRQ